MGFIKTGQEIEQLQQIMAIPQALDGTMLTIQFGTDAAFIERVLPPGLTPGKNALGSIYIGKWANSSAGAYHGAAVFVSARAGDLEGDYCLAFYVSNNQASLFGRPMMGEPKKLADIDFERKGNRITAGVTRYNERIISIDAELTGSMDDLEMETTAFYYKHCPAPDGQGLQYDPLLIQQSVTQKLNHLELGSASLQFASTAHDPLSEIPVQDLRMVVYSEGSMFAKVNIVTSVDREAFLPYAFSAYDDWVSLQGK